MSAKKWVGIWFVITIFSIFIIGAFNYIIDPYGYFSTQNKYSFFLTRINKPTVLNTKLYTNGQIYIIGTSRQMRVNPNLIASYTHKEVRNINISGSTFSENFMIAKRVKELNKNFIYGFDAFSLNEYRIKNFEEIKNRYKSYQNELQNNTNKNLVLLKSMFNSDIFYTALKHLAYKYILHRDLYFNDIKENTTLYDYNKTKIINKFNNHDDKSNYKLFHLYNDKEIIKLAKLADKNDIFIIYPKYFFYYKMFQEYQNIEKKYFHAIKLLVQNTKAKVWCFYGINNITINLNNFDKDGWHFKPKVAKIIYDDVYLQKYHYGILLTKDNVDNVLDSLHNQVKNYPLDKIVK